MQFERRQHPRHASHWPLTISGTDESGEPFEIRALTRDVSGGGIAFTATADAPLARGQRVAIAVETMDGKTHRLGNGMVMWIEGGRASPMQHAGVMMEDLTCMQRMLPVLLAETSPA